MTRRVFMLAIACFLLADRAPAEEVPSCLNVNMFMRGAAAPCAPPRISDQEASSTMKRLGLEQIEHDWYLFAPESWWLKQTIPARWKVLIQCVSSIQAAQGGSSNLYMAIAPDDEIEKRAFVRSGVPKSKIKAAALHRNTGNLFESNGKTYPNGHHSEAYTLVIYH